MTKTHTIHTAIGVALIGAALVAIEAGAPMGDKVVNQVVDAAGNNKHVVKRPDWNASLTFKTAQKLKKDGIIT